MPAIRAAKKPAAKRSTALSKRPPRVTQDEGRSRSTKKSAEHRSAESSIMGMARDLGNGEILVSYQISELVPVGQYANVTIGPILIAGKITGNMDVLAEVNWADDTPLTEEQQALYDRLASALAGEGNIVQVRLNDDREEVLDSVRQANEREASEASSKKKASRVRRS